MIFPNSQSICYLVHFHISLETFLPFISFYHSAAPQINFQIHPAGVDFRLSRLISAHTSPGSGKSVSLISNNMTVSILQPRFRSDFEMT